MADSSEEKIILQKINYLEHIRQSKFRTIEEEISALVGQKRLLSAINPEYEFGETGNSVAQYSKKLASEIDEITRSTVNLNKTLSSMSDSELGAYADRWMGLGELAALKKLTAEKFNHNQ